MKTRINELLNIQYPIIRRVMMWVAASSRAELISRMFNEAKEALQDRLATSE